MGLSVGSVGNSYGMSYIRPMNYALKNQSEVSDAFKETGMGGAVTNVPPVVYPNAQVAEKYQGMTTGYSQNGQARNYEIAGSTLDLYA